MDDNTLDRFARPVLQVLFFLMFFMGCGEPVPSSNDADAGTPTADRGGQTGSDTGMRADGGTMIGDGGAPMVCRAYLRTLAERMVEIATCRGTLCQPNEEDPLCVHASSCTCGDMTAAMRNICSGSTDASCQARLEAMMRDGTVSCRPGHNRCSPHLPEGVENTRFWLDPDLSGHPLGSTPWIEARQRMTYGLNHGWRNFASTLPEFPLRPLSGTCAGAPMLIYDQNGFIVICLPAFDPMMGLPEGTELLMTCVGRTCYWNRSSALRAVSFSVEVNWPRSRDTCFTEICGIRVRVWAPGATTPRFDIEAGVNGFCEPPGRASQCVPIP